MFSKFFAFLVICLTATNSIAGPLENQSRPDQKDVKENSNVSPFEKVISVDSPQPQQQQQDPSVGSEGSRGQRSYSPSENDVVGPPVQLEESLVQKLNVKCAQKDPSSCAMLKLITYMNRLFKKANIDISENVEITQTTSVTELKAEDLPRSISQASVEAQTTELLTAKLLSFIRSRALRLRLVPSLDAVITSNPDSDGNLNLGMTLQHVPEGAQEGRGKGGMKGGGGILALGMMKAGMVAALALKGLALLAGKALIVSKIALLLAAIAGAASLFQQDKRVTYDIVAQPHHTHSHVEHIEHGHGGGGHDSYSSGWGRSADVGKKHSMAYRAYVPKH